MAFYNFILKFLFFFMKFDCSCKRRKVLAKGFRWILRKFCTNSGVGVFTRHSVIFIIPILLVSTFIQIALSGFRLKTNTSETTVKVWYSAYFSFHNDDSRHVLYNSISMTVMTNLTFQPSTILIQVFILAFIMLRSALPEAHFIYSHPVQSNSTAFLYTSNTNKFHLNECWILKRITTVAIICWFL